MMSLHISSVLEQTVKSTQAMTDAMKGVTKALVKMNKMVDLPSINKIMAEFMKENERNEIIQETVGDTIDDVMEEEGGAEEENLLFEQIMAEIGAKTTETVPELPSSMAIKQPATAESGKNVYELFIDIVTLSCCRSGKR